MATLAPPATPGGRNISGEIPATPTTDFALIEAQKENIVPLSTGRSAAILSNVLTKERSEADRMVHDGHERHKRLIEEANRREAEGDELPEGVNDVLEPYCSYVAFIMQHHPSSPTHLLPLLESTTRKFVEDTRFQQDLRYLKLWAQYARLVERSDDVWSFLNSREVGTGHALFYEEWALAAESKGKVSSADEIYRLGVNRKAQPLKRLQTSYQGYKNRAAGIEEEISERSANPSRTALAARLPGGQSAPSGGLQQSSGPKTLLGQPINGAKLDVFSDAGTRGGLDQREGEWEDMGTREGNRKENFMEAMPWKGEVMKQDKTKVTPRAPKMSVFSDSDEGAFAKPLPPTFVADSIRSDPLKNFGKDAKKAPSEGKKSSKTKSSSSKAKPAPANTDEGQEVVGKNGKIERRMFQWDQVFRNGTEYCFEELRAASMGLGDASSSGWGAKDVRDWELEWHVPTINSPVKPKPNQFKPPSPTVNTKAAMAEVHQLFNQTLTGRRRSNGAINEDDEDDDSEDDSEDDDDDEDDEDMKTSAVPPTPLPMPGTAPRMVMGMATPSRMIPATPTPAQGYLSGRNKPASAVGAIFEEEDEELPVLGKPAFGIFSDKNAKPAVFADENARPAVFADENEKPAVFAGENAKPAIFQDENAAVPVKLAVFADENAPTPSFADENGPRATGRDSVFGQTPMKTPLAPRTTKTLSPPGQADSPERVASVFSDQRFTTPVTGQRVFGQSKPMAATTETREQQGIEEEQDCPPQMDHHQEEPDYNPRRIVRCGGAFDMMTPITERTCEYTQSTQAFTLRSSTSSALTQSQRRAEEDEEDSAGEEERHISEGVQGLSVVHEESESSRRSEPATIADRESSPLVPFDEGTGEQGSRRSDTAHTLFQLSPGHTIQPCKDTDKDTERVEEAAGPVLEEEDLRETAAQPESPEVYSSQSNETPVEPRAVIETPERSSTRPEKLMVPIQDLPSPTAEAVIMFNPSNPCSPTDPDVMQPLIAALQPPITELPNFVDMRQRIGGQLEELQKVAKTRSRRNSTSTGNKSASGANTPWELTLHGRRFEIEEKIGEGGFGAVFKAIDLAAREAADDASDDEDDDVNPEALYTLALKVEKPANVWEAVVLERIRTRLAPEHHPSIVKSRGLYCYQDESILLLDYYDQGTLLNAVNKAAAWGIAAPAAGAAGGLDETLAIFFTIELLRLVEALHRADFIHGDLKIDNCLIRLDETDEWTSQYEMNGENGWSGKGIHIIDLGRTIDLQAYPLGTAQTFIADWAVDAKDCQEMRDGRPWSYQADYYGLASICYCMLFGKYITTELAPATPEDGDNKRYRIAGSFKRYWQTELWQSLFDLLLNPKLSTSTGALPVHDQLAALRGEFQCWLEENCTKGGRNLKNLLSKIELKAGINK